MGLAIKLAQERDVSVLNKHLSFGTSGKHQKRVELQGEGRGLYFIAWEKETPTGHAFVNLDGPGERVVRDTVGVFPNLEDLLVVKERRGSGVGTKLMKEIEKQLCERGYGMLGFGVAGGKPGIIDFYKTLGYERADIEPFEISWEGVGGEEHSEPHVFLMKNLDCIKQK